MEGQKAPQIHKVDVRSTFVVNPKSNTARIWDLLEEHAFLEDLFHPERFVFVKIVETIAEMLNILPNVVYTFKYCQQNLMNDDKGSRSARYDQRLQNKHLAELAKNRNLPEATTSTVSEAIAKGEKLTEIRTQTNCGRSLFLKYVRPNSINLKSMMTEIRKLPSIEVSSEPPIPTKFPASKIKVKRNKDERRWGGHANEKEIVEKLNPSSKIREEDDFAKYKVAKLLKKKIVRIRKTYRDEWKSNEMRIRQHAVALYFIDILGLTVGYEKHETGTVGCCSLRYEHVSLHDELNGNENVVVFDFHCGKIHYSNEVSVEKRVYKSLQLFKENKKEGDELFDRLNTITLKNYLRRQMESLTSKVFRIYNLSFTLQNQLDELTEDGMSIPEKLLAYIQAKRSAPILCNYPRTVPKTQTEANVALKEKIRLQIEEVGNQIKEFECGSTKGKKKEHHLKELKAQLCNLKIRAEAHTILLGVKDFYNLDPRIFIAWCKKYSVPVEKIFNKTVLRNFCSTIETIDKNYKFMSKYIS